MYVTELVVADTVNTMPEATIKATADHGELRGDTVHGTYDASRQVFADLQNLGISYDDVVQVLEDEGVAKFEASWNELLGTIKKNMGRRLLSDSRCPDPGRPGDPDVEEPMIKMLYKPVSLLVSVLGGVLAGAIFKRVWKVSAGEDDAPKATEAGRGWREVLLAAALQGAIFALVKAAVDRAAAKGTYKLTGTWPGPEDQRSDGDAWPRPAR